MRCPNCQSVVGNNYGVCQYCGYDIGEYVRSVQDNGKWVEEKKRDKRATLYTSAGHDVLTEPVYNYENGYFYYKKAYESEREKNDRYRRNLLLGGASIVLLLHLAEILALAAIYLT